MKDNITKEERLIMERDITLKSLFDGIKSKVLANKYGIRDTSIRSIKKRFLGTVYRDYMSGLDPDRLCLKYKVTLDELRVMLKAAEKYYGIGLCQTKIKL